jgi:hypothetical protein
MFCLPTFGFQLDILVNKLHRSARVRAGAGQFVQFRRDHELDARHAAAALRLGAAAAEHPARRDVAALMLHRKLLNGESDLRAGDDVAVTDDHGLTY